MQALCQQLKEIGTKHNILRVLTLVCQRVAIEFVSNNQDDIDQKKQIPCIMSMLTRMLYFHEK